MNAFGFQSHAGAAGWVAGQTVARMVCAVSLVVAASGRAAEGNAGATVVRPTAAQVVWQDLGLAVRVPFGLGPFLGRAVGTGHEAPVRFNPEEFAPGQWVRIVQAAGGRLLLLTAKQRDGFCLWPSRWTEYSVKASPWQNGRGDVVREVALACQAAGLRFGLEYALCDHHEPAASNPAAYNQFLQRQLTELLTEFGELTELWLDDACPKHGKGVVGRIDWAGLLGVARDLQPRCLLAGAGPDVRSLAADAVIRRDSAGSVWALDPQVPWAGLFAEHPFRWRPVERRAGLRPSLFYRTREDNRQLSVRQLLDLYRRSVGRNASLLLSVPADATGVIPEHDARRLAEFGQALRGRFGIALAETAGTGPTLTLKLDPAHPIGALLAEEEIRDGERVRRFLIEAVIDDGWRVLAEGRQLGHRQIVRFDARNTRAVRLRVLEKTGDAPVQIRRLAAFPPAPAK